MAQNIVTTVAEFFFRGKSITDTSTGKPKVDAKGEKVIVKDRENFKLQLPFLSLDGILEITTIGTDQAKTALLGAVNRVIYAQAKKQVDEGVSDQVGLDAAKLSWDYIAQLSASELTESTSPSKEVLAAIEADYVAIMPTAQGISLEAAKAAGKEIARKFSTYRNSTEILPKLQARLAQWFEATERQQEFAEAFDWLNNKASAYLEESTKAASGELF